MCVCRWIHRRADGSMWHRQILSCCLLQTPLWKGARWQRSKVKESADHRHSVYFYVDRFYSLRCGFRTTDKFSCSAWLFGAQQWEACSHTHSCSEQRSKKASLPISHPDQSSAFHPAITRWILTTGHTFLLRCIFFQHDYTAGKKKKKNSCHEEVQNMWPNFYLAQKY